MNKVWKSISRIPIVIQIIIALIGGAIAGICIGTPVLVLEPIGELMLKLFKMVVMPLIFCAIVVGVGSNPIRKTGRITLKIIPYYICTTVIASAIACTLSLIFTPGVEMYSGGNAQSLNTSSIVLPSFSEFVLGLVPENVVNSFASNSYLQVVVFAIIFGFSISALRDNNNEEIKDSIIIIYSVCKGTLEIMFFLVKVILRITPIGVFSLIAVSFAENGIQTLKSATEVVGIIYFGYAIHLILIYPSILILLGKTNPIVFYKKIREAMIMAFSTRSSSSTLPVTIRVAKENMGVSENVASLTLPLGSQINLDGEALYQIVAVFMVSFASGITFELPQIILLVIIVTFGGSGTAGIAGSGPVILMGIMGMVGLDISTGTNGGSVFALLLGLDVILDMGRTMVNVTGDLVGTCIVAKSESELDMNKWNN